MSQRSAFHSRIESNRRAAEALLDAAGRLLPLRSSGPAQERLHDLRAALRDVLHQLQSLTFESVVAEDSLQSCERWLDQANQMLIDVFVTGG